MSVYSKVSKMVHDYELKALKNYLSKKPATLNMVAHALVMPLEAVCLHKQELEQKGEIIALYLDKCEVTGVIMEYYSTDPLKLKKKGDKEYLRKCNPKSRKK